MAGINDAFSSISNFDFGGILSKGLSLVVVIFLAAVAFGTVFMIYRWRNSKTDGTEKEIYWWEDLNGNMAPVKVETVKEVTVPGTNLRVFYAKKSDTWLPRFTRGVNAKIFYVAITKNKEIVNFTLKSLSEDMKEAGLDYDHTDMRWASENLREYIKRNYRDKSMKWWKEYQGVITTAIYIMIMTFSIGIMLYMMRGLVADIGNVAAQVATYIDKMDACTKGGAAIVQQAG